MYPGFLLRRAAFPVIGIDAHCDSPKRGRELQRIIEEIGNYILQLNAIDGDGAKVPRREKLDCSSSRSVRYLPVGDNLFDTLIDIAKLLADLDFTGFQSTEVEKAFNHPLQPQRILLHLGKNVALLGVERPGVISQQKIRISGNYREGRLEFMRRTRNQQCPPENFLFQMLIPGSAGCAALRFV
jgi:hypothetical protein